MRIKEIINNCRALAEMKRNFSDEELEREILDKQLNKVQCLLKEYLFSYLQELDKQNKAVEDCDSFLTLFQEFPEMRRSVYSNSDNLVIKHCCRLYKVNPVHRHQIKDLILLLKPANRQAVRKEKHYETRFVQGQAS